MNPETNVAASSPLLLVVEDEPKTRDSVAEGLRLEGWTTETAASGEAALQLCEQRAFDLVVLDWMLPDIDGMGVLQHLRARGYHTPVLILTARAALRDRVDGLEGGADDYLVKPFAFAELVARCRALLRRPVLSTARVMQCGELQLDTRARTAVFGGQEIALTPREVDVLEFLLRHQGRVVSRGMLEREVWKQTQRVTSLDNVIDVQMMRLRRKLEGPNRSPLLHTVRGIGYRLGGPAVD